ncbi:MAG: hypothetical protein QNJ31_07510 [Candidatus Caenarcaniphilales bacterium]|nr:hypothetical protein [Candidatus Caenarcaniphilales bacterium]
MQIKPTKFISNILIVPELNKRLQMGINVGASFNEFSNCPESLVERIGIFKHGFQTFIYKLDEPIKTLLEQVVIGFLDSREEADIALIKRLNEIGRDIEKPVKELMRHGKSSIADIKTVIDENIENEELNSALLCFYERIQNHIESLIEPISSIVNFNQSKNTNH